MLAARGDYPVNKPGQAEAEPMRLPVITELGRHVDALGQAENRGLEPTRTALMRTRTIILALAELYGTQMQKHDAHRLAETCTDIVALLDGKTANTTTASPAPQLVAFHDAAELLLFSLEHRLALLDVHAVAPIPDDTAAQS